jgi:hypothetical protein
MTTSRRFESRRRKKISRSRFVHQLRPPESSAHGTSAYIGGRVRRNPVTMWLRMRLCSLWRPVHRPLLSTFFYVSSYTVVVRVELGRFDTGSVHRRVSRMADALEKERQIAVLIAEQRTAAQKLQTLQSQLDAALVEKQALQTKDAQTSRKLVPTATLTAPLVCKRLNTRV